MITDCDIYSPFGAGSPSYTDVVCTFVNDSVRGKVTTPYDTLSWTHYIEIDDADSAVILDGITRTEPLNNLNYNDGDEIRIPAGGPTRYVVVWVTQRRNEDGVVRRAYLMRHSVS